MASHLRVGSVVDIEWQTPTGVATGQGTVSNLTDSYIEIEGHPALIGNSVFPWSHVIHVTVTTD